MLKYRKILELHFEGTSQRTIAPAVGHSRTTISEVIKRAKEKGIGELTEVMDDHWLSEYLFPEKQAIEQGYYPPDWEYVHRELQRKNVTLMLLHLEYSETAREENKVPYSYRTFAEKYRKFAKKTKATMPIRRKPGEIIETDWAGSVLSLKSDQHSGKIPVYIFVAALPYSQYAYAEGFTDMTSDSWIAGHIHAFQFFGGVAECLTPDNLKTGVQKVDKVDPILNQSYREMAEHYHTVVIPARRATPRDKSTVEGTVKLVSQQIIAALRDYQCFELEQLNQRIFDRLEKINTTPFQKKPGSRKSVFDEEEKQRLLPLPSTRYTRTEWRTAKVPKDYHIQVKQMDYSVPYEYIGDTVDVRMTDYLVEVYFKEARIASHKRLKGESGQRITDYSHMPDNHQYQAMLSPSSCVTWAKTVGPSMGKYVTKILELNVEKKALNILSAVQSLERNFTLEELEVAAETILSVASSAPTFSMLKTILQRNRKRMKSQINGTLIQDQTKNNYGFVRGAEFFGGKNK